MPRFVARPGNDIIAVAAVGEVPLEYKKSELYCSIRHACAACAFLRHTDFRE
jgi:hypothetical protein